jgi:hypothetical protein
MSDTLLALHVFSHDSRIFHKVPDSPEIVKILLSNLTVDEQFKGEQLAENRFFISKESNCISADLIGCVSARWDERFPTYPKLDELHFYAKNLKMHEVIAPQSLILNKSQFTSWLKNQDAVHPGISKLLHEAINQFSISMEGKSYNLVMGNNFIISSEVYEDFLIFWRQGFEYFHRKYGFRLPFTYRCPRCGFESNNGVGRWEESRHAAFFYERLTALFFANRRDLKLLGFKDGKMISRKKGLESILMPIGPAMFRLIKMPGHLFSTCDHLYQSPGKR